MKGSPTKLSLDRLRSDGWTAEVVEHWNPHAGIRQDFLGCIDIIALRGSETLAVQTTSRNHLSHRVRKIADSPNIGAMREAGWSIVVHGWWQPKGPGTRYELETRDVS